ncbi:type 1 glutamine amidotransferase domain-containing protein [uncultured Microbacterium sp.]|uniref:type 1 glutamine amidotransferase domain-containing protein n=1 Tax=uncultured Microbacterium sp. TaxID=191216 RepID=UPI0035CAEE64
MAKVLMVVSAATHWTQADGSKHPSGYWAEELVVPHEALTRAGHTVDIATPGGRAPTVDQTSFNPDIAGPEVERFAAYIDGISDVLENTVPLEEVDVAGYDAVLIPGGHGPMEDLAVDRSMGRVLRAAHADDKIIAAICHGPAALLSAADGDGEWPFAGRTVTSLTDEEETLFGTAANAAWLLESRLRENGAQFVGSVPWQSHVVVDGRLITGQNPGSSAETAQELNALLASDAN